MKSTKKILSSNTFRSSHALGQKVWLVVLSNKDITGPCPMCEGIKWVYSKSGASHRCPTCYGTGEEVCGRKEQWEVAPTAYYIKGIALDITKSKIAESFVVARGNRDNGGNYARYQEVYTTKNAAEKVCEKLNSKL